jgi:hypothetical protein|tara:strand:+ start:1915 stop:2475 length:561 start_codon:yes stop_codon:yes gene_type:complete
MARISNKQEYPVIFPIPEDYFVLTDADSSELETKTCSISRAKVIVDSPFYDVSVTVDAAQMFDLFNNPLTIISAPGANKVINVLSIIGHLQYNGIPFNSGSQLNITQGLNTLYNPIGSTNNIGGFQSASFVNEVQDLTLIQNGSNFQVGINDPVLLQYNVSAGVPTTGNGNIKINIRYQIINLLTS